MVASPDIVETDYVVVGAGSAGCVVVARLSEDPSSRVVVLEAGPPDKSFWIHVPIGYGKTIIDPRLNWRYETEPDAEINNRRMFWARGRVLGGSSSINGLLYIRGQAEDYDHWRQLGNAGWSYDDVLPYFKRSEAQQNGADTYHGAGGPLAVANLIERNPLCEAFIESAVASGIPRSRDFNGPSQEGVGYYQLTTRRAKRCSAAVAFLRPAMKRPNVRVVTGAFVERVLFEGRRATGVVCRQGDRQMTVRTAREVVLSGGSINSPQLLMLSGVGPAVHLAALGIPLVHDLPGVGQNLQDHYGAILTYRSRLKTTVNDIMVSPTRRMMVGLQYLLFRRGPLTVSAAQVGAFIRSRPEVATPDIQFLFQTFSHDEYDHGLHKFSGFANVVCPTRPESRGALTLRSRDPRDPPLMRANYLAAEIDRRTLVAAIKIGRRVAEHDAIRRHILADYAPGPDVQTDDELLAYARETGLSIAHQVGTCKMGSDPMAVVDQTLAVHGIAGLRVVDASIMPTLISGNTNAPTIMIGEKGADYIRAAAR